MNVAYRLLALGALACFMPVLSGCPTDACDGDEQSFGKLPGEGRMVSADEWETNPVSGTWLPLPPQRVWVFFPVGLAGRQLRAPKVYISAESDPARASGNFTLASGNLGEVGVFGDTFYVRNNTCGAFIMRAEVEAYPASASPSPADASSISPLPGDAGSD